ncbi:MAG TPA: hypothetical protein VJU58_14230 [Microbacterium sp.]|nr:hypothetical protein [Microbacterium sp.]
MSDPVTPGAQGEPVAAGASDPLAHDDPRAARRYSAPDLGAPQYAVPAYAAPETGEPAPPVGTPVHYAAPQGYSLPGGDLGAGATASAFPPYARPTAAPAPGSSVTPGYGGTPGYPGSLGWSANQAVAASPPSGGRDGRPKTLAIIALILAAAGVLLAFAPYVAGSFGSGWLSFLLLFAAFVLSIVALVSRNQGGKGIGVGALITSVLGGILTVVLTIAWAFGSFASSFGGGAEPGDEDSQYYEDYSVPGIAAPGSDGQPDPGAEFAPPVQPTVVETAFGHEYDDVWWYAVVVDNSNADYVFDAYMEVRAVTEDGSTVAPSSAFATLLAGRTAVVGYFFEVGDTQLTSIDVTVPRASDATLSPADETGSFTVDGIARSSSDSTATSATGTLSARFAEDQRYVSVTALARAADGAIVAAATAYVEDVPGDGTPVPFEVWFADLPPDATLQAFAHR